MVGVINLKVPMEEVTRPSEEDVNMFPLESIIWYQFRQNGTRILDKEFSSGKSEIEGILKQYGVSPEEVLSYNTKRKIINIDARHQKIHPYINQELQLAFKKYNKISDIPWELLFR